MADAVRAPRPKRRVIKDDLIQVRASAATKAMLVEAAALRGQRLSEFVLESARRSAEEAILDQRVFFLDPAAHDAFLALLDNPPPLDPAVVARHRRQAPWDG